MVAVRWRNLIGQRYLAVEPGAGSGALADGDTVVNASQRRRPRRARQPDSAPLAQAVSPDELNRILSTVIEALRRQRRQRSTPCSPTSTRCWPRSPSATAPSRRCCPTTPPSPTRWPGATSRSDRWSRTWPPSPARSPPTTPCSTSALAEFAGFSTNLDAFLGAIGVRLRLRARVARRPHRHGVGQHRRAGGGAQQSARRVRGVVAGRQPRRVAPGEHVVRHAEPRPVPATRWRSATPVAA